MRRSSIQGILRILPKRKGMLESTKVNEWQDAAKMNASLNSNKSGKYQPFQEKVDYKLECKKWKRTAKELKFALESEKLKRVEEEKQHKLEIEEWRN